MASNKKTETKRDSRGRGRKRERKGREGERGWKRKRESD